MAESMLRVILSLFAKPRNVLRYVSHRKYLMADIVLLSTADWDHPLWTNKQHVACALAAEGERVLYVEFLVCAQFKPKLRTQKDFPAAVSWPAFGAGCAAGDLGVVAIGFARRLRWDLASHQPFDGAMQCVTRLLVAAFSFPMALDVQPVDVALSAVEGV